MTGLPDLHPELGLPGAAELRACEACRLKGRGEPVPGEAWNVGENTVILIGEAPGPTEAKTGRPFVGESGRRLRRLLAEAGIKDFYLTNTVRHWPTRNRVPKDDELEACLPFLAREIAVIQPKVIVLVGETSMCLAFKAKGRVKKTHGRWSTLYEIPTAAMIHPAAIGRMTQKDRGAWEGACLSVLAQARRKAEGWELPDVPWTDAQGAPVPLVSALDIEATGTDPRVADMVLAAAYDGEVARVYKQPSDMTFARAYPHNRAYFVTHNSAYDATLLMRHGVLGAREMDLEDTMVLAHVMGLTDLSLKGLSAKLLDEPMPAFEELFGDDAAAADQRKLAGYCARDAVQTLKLFYRLHDQARPEDVKVYEDIERPLLPIFAEMTAFGGFELDQEGIQAELDVTTNQMEKLDFVFRSLVEEPTINIKSGDQVAAVLKDKLGLPLTKLVPKKDRVAVGAAVLRGIEAHHPCVGVLLQYRVLEKRKSTYLLKWSKLKRLTALWHQTGTRTGRSSSSGPNLQNIPNNLRKYLTARPGKKFVAADYSQVEYRVAAHLSQDPAMIQAYLDGRDMHDETARMMWPDAEEITAEMRRRAKILNFGGILFGGCFVAGTRVLTKDLRWKPIEKVTVGETLLAFDETPRQPNKQRHWRGTTVTAQHCRMAKVVRVTFDDGSQVTCTPDHPFLSWGSSDPWRPIVPPRRGKRRYGRVVRRVLPTWNDDDTREAGWLAGFYDGEAHLRVRNSPPRHGLSLGVAQNPGPTLNEAVHYLRAKGFTPGKSHSMGEKCVRVNLLGGVAETLRFLGQIRPERLIRHLNAHDDIGAMYKLAMTRVVNVEPLGVAPVYNLTTTTRTFIAEGFAVHNSPDKMLEEAQRYNYPLTYKEAENAIRQAQRERPTYYAWAAETAHKGLTDQYIDGLYGHRFYLAEGLSYQELNKLGRQAVNYPIQGGARDIVKIGMAKAWSVLLMPIVADNHDELIFEVDEGEADEFALALKPILEYNNPLDVPLLVDIRVGWRWKE